MARIATLNIRTPEGVVFSQHLAGPMIRFLAWCVDFLVMLLFLWIAGIVLTFFSIISPEIAQALQLLSLFGFSIGYSIITEWKWRGQTIGKRLMRLRVVDVHGLRLKPGQIVIRNLLRVVDMLPMPYLVGGVMCLLSTRCQRLGDLAANTIVIRIPKLTQPNLDQLLADKYNSLRAYPHLEARLRQRVSPAEAAVALQAIIRRDTLEPRARVILFEDLAGRFKGSVPFPPEASEGITDEQYVRNVVDCLFRPGRKRMVRRAADEQPLPHTAGPSEPSSSASGIPVSSP